MYFFNVFTDRTIEDEIYSVSNEENFISAWFCAIGYAIAHICDIALCILFIGIILFLAMLPITFIYKITVNHFLWTLPFYIFSLIMAIVTYIIRRKVRNNKEQDDC